MARVLVDLKAYSLSNLFEHTVELFSLPDLYVLFSIIHYLSPKGSLPTCK